jgi:hypothetical protein
MKTMRISLLAFLLIVALSPFFLTCAPSGGDATVNIKLGFAHDEASNRSVIDRILNFFATRAYADPPVPIESITVRVTGPGMPTMDFIFAPDITTAIVVVPAGSSRKFTVTAIVAPGDPSAALAFRGIATADLAVGETVNLSVSMIVSETKIVIPDYYNNRIVQIDNMDGDNWIENSVVSSPYDIDFDARGRIYIATESEPGVQRIDNINDNTTEGIPIMSSILSLAINRHSGIIYYADSFTLYRNSIDGTNEIQLVLDNPSNIESIDQIIGMDIDENGILYIAGTATTEDEMIFKYDPALELVTDIYRDNLNTPWDVIVKSPYVYVANYEYNMTVNNKVLRLTMGLQPAGELRGDPGSADTFYGPHRFVAILNRKIYITDEGHDPSSPYNRDRLVSIDNISGANWKTYGSYGTGQDQFDFIEHWWC